MISNSFIASNILAWSPIQLTKCLWAPSPMRPAQAPKLSLPSSLGYIQMRMATNTMPLQAAFKLPSIPLPSTQCWPFWVCFYQSPIHNSVVALKYNEKRQKFLHGHMQTPPYYTTLAFLTYCKKNNNKYTFTIPHQLQYIHSYMNHISLLPLNNWFMCCATHLLHYVHSTLLRFSNAWTQITKKLQLTWLLQKTNQIHVISQHTT